MYIVFEGIDGCGKTTQIELLKNVFSNLIVTKEPGGTDFGIKAREILLHSEIKSPKAELLLFLADRAEHYKDIIEPNLDSLVVSDRGFLSGIAYALQAGFDLDFLIELNLFTLDSKLPDRVVLFEITEEELKNRIVQTKRDKIEARGFDYLLNIQESMKMVAKKMKLNYTIVDATAKIEDIHKQIIEYISK